MTKFLLILLIGFLLSNVSHAASLSYFTCKYSGGSSKIKISGGTAVETTSAGIVITYAKATKTPSGGYALEGSSKGNRKWGIGAISILLLGNEINSTNIKRAECR